MSEKGQTLTVVQTEEFEMLACKPEYGRASNGLPYSLVVHDKYVGGHEMAQFTKIVQMVLVSDKDTPPDQIVERAAEVTQAMIAMGLHKGWLKKVPTHNDIERALRVTDKITGATDE